MRILSTVCQGPSLTYGHSPLDITSADSKVDGSWGRRGLNRTAQTGSPSSERMKERGEEELRDAVPLAASPEAGVNDIAEGVAQHVEAVDGQGDG